MRNELQRHKRSDKVKWVLTGIMFFLAFIMIAGLILQVFGTGKTKPSEWFKKQDSEQTEQPPAEGGKNGTARTRVKAMAATFAAESNKNEDGITPLSVTREISAPTGAYCYKNDFVSFFWEDTQITTIQGEAISAALYIMADATYMWVYVTSIRSVFFDVYAIYKAEIKISGASDSFMVPLSRQSDNSLASSYIPLLNILTGITSDRLYMTSNACIRCEKSPVSLPADPVKEGHTFVGWYYDSAFTRPYDGQPIYADTQLYAKFEIHKFTVTFNSDGGSAVANQSVNWNTAATLTTPTREKYAFKGWFLPNGTQYTNQPIKENTTLTAQWERNVFNVTFGTNGGTWVDNMEVNLNSSVTLPATTRTGYIFKGWFLSDGTQYTNQPVTDDMTLTAHWEVQTFTVTFYVDGEVYSTKTVEYGQGLAKVAETANLKMLSVRMESGVPTFDDNGAVIVTENCSVEAQEMSDTDKAINTVKQNKWAIIGGVAGGVALIAVIAAVCGGKRKRKR